ncbi:ribonuclease H2 subunit A-like [Apostichopus japonicus]|uniref:ribonuclease H2 subunit A-like n=1 Tax=Stichopus japonicus TaxID=307972 RepID=UPI003AB41F24
MADPEEMQEEISVQDVTDDVEKVSSIGSAEVDLSKFETDNNKNFTIQSQVPKICEEEDCCLGIDEAGRGPVLGPMVYGVSYCPLSKNDELKAMGFADSKTLTEEQREVLLKSIQDASDFIGYNVQILTPSYISSCMLGRTKYSLNQVSMDSAISLLRLAIESGAKIKEVYVDTVGDASKYQAKLQALFPTLDITVTPKADSKFPIVSAASICAKVVRDRVIQSWKFKEGTVSATDNYGSGYPSDPATKRWLSENVDPIFGFPRFIRFSWSTASNILEKKAAIVEWEDDDEEEVAKGSASLLSFFAPKNFDSRKKKHQFFEESGLTQLTTF